MGRIKRGDAGFEMDSDEPGCIWVPPRFELSLILRFLITVKSHATLIGLATRSLLVQ